ncbi:hypothetical protein V6N13_124102 [Hibiscus sabdariffa]|uniref:Uncharacterized protein n=1 Tax=Hibiscus sabdariffa TaxID=183260 RepID=A0ABR2S156_9ROSI
MLHPLLTTFAPTAVSTRAPLPPAPTVTSRLVPTAHSPISRLKKGHGMLGSKEVDDLTEIKQAIQTTVAQNGE